ncbi:hypothetical protein TorRG33x02_204850 [Trema orientale]|uniref:Uncharacterized protein n=1 Tax=Trema orientale TaxID=63057 RepID=A0A2P5EDR3_TREOI|nr:hypothetical protein TorRG33x02_204850 [Trema orientale]
MPIRITNRPTANNRSEGVNRVFSPNGSNFQLVLSEIPLSSLPLLNSQSYLLRSLPPSILLSNPSTKPSLNHGHGRLVQDTVKKDWRNNLEIPISHFELLSAAVDLAVAIEYSWHDFVLDHGLQIGDRPCFEITPVEVLPEFGIGCCGGMGLFDPEDNNDDYEDLDEEEELDAVEE